MDWAEIKDMNIAPFEGEARVAEALLALRDELSIKHVVETGTGFGFDSQWFVEHFDKLTSIEIQRNLQRRAATLMPNGNFICGDAGEKMASIVEAVPRDDIVLFFLNGFRTDRPEVMRELRAICRLRQFVVVVNCIKSDEASRLPGTTMTSLRQLLDDICPLWKSVSLSEEGATMKRVLIYPAGLTINSV